MEGSNVMKKWAIRTSGILLAMVMLCALLPLSFAHAAASYTLIGTSLTASGVEYQDYLDGRYCVSLRSTLLSWENGNAPTSDSYVDAVFDLYKDAALSQPLSTEPEYDTDYYFERLIQNNTANDDSLVFTALEVANCCNVTITGYDTECVSVTTGDYYGKKNVRILYKIRKKGSTTSYPVWVGNTQVTEKNKDDILDDGGKAKYNPETNTLTLNNPTVSGSHNNGMICYNPGPDDPDLLKITGSATINDGNTKVGILGIESSIELNGTFDIAGTEWGIGAWNITVSGGTVTAHGGESGISSYKEITISGGTVNATGDAKYGIESEESSVTISGGTVNTTGRTNGIIATEGSIAISGGKVTAKALVPYESAAISAGKDITISGGTVTAQDGNNGIRALNGTVSIENGTEKVLADGTTYSIRADSISIGDDMMIKEPEDGTVEKDEFDANVIMDGSSVANHALIVPKETVTFTVTFNANGHGTTPASQTINSGEKAAEPTDPTETGWIFGGWYKEAACTNAFNFSTPITGNITLYARWTEEGITPAKITYMVTGGSNSTWIKDSNSNATITVKRSAADDTCFSHFSSVQIDGTTLAAGDYEARSGSTVITLKAATLQKLSVGDHTVTINFDDGKAETKLTIKAAQPAVTPEPTKVPQTGDSANFPLWIGFILLGLIGISVLGLTAIRYRK